MKAYEVEKRMIPSPSGEMKVLILHPTINIKPESKTPGILWIHGGGYVTGMAEMIYMSRAKALVEKYGAVVITPEYRLAGKAPYPAALEDCYSALLYLKKHSEELRCNPNQIMVGGESAGGGLTVALCLYVRDKGEVNISFQMPLYPMIDNQDTESSRDNHGISWNTRRNHAAWKKYLRGLSEHFPYYAVPARAEDLTNLPPSYTFIGNKEPFYSETLTFMEKLRQAGVKANVDTYPTGFHAFDMLLPWRKISKEAIIKFEKEYLYAAEHYFANQK